MKVKNLFQVLPDDFFKPLTSKYKREYADCILLIFNSFKPEISYGVNREIVVKVLEGYFEVDDTEISFDEQTYLKDAREKANAMIASLKACGWLEYVSMKGQAILVLGEQTLDLSKMKGDVALSTDSLKGLTKIRVIGKRVVTVENLTSFHKYEGLDDFVIYLGGFHNKVKRTFLMFLYEQNPEKEYLHFGDIDAGGFYIFEHLKMKTGIPFKTLHMDVETLVKHETKTKQLSPNDRLRINSLLAKENEYNDVLKYMLEHNCKLEQEALDID